MCLGGGGGISTEGGRISSSTIGGGEVANLNNMLRGLDLLVTGLCHMAEALIFGAVMMLC